MWRPRPPASSCLNVLLLCSCWFDSYLPQVCTNQVITQHSDATLMMFQLLCVVVVWPCTAAPRLALARVSVLRGSGPHAGSAFIDDYVASVEPVVDYLTRWSGIRPGRRD